MVMPWVNKLERKKISSPNRNETEMRKIRQKAYQNKNWRKMRDTYLKEHPICEECLKKGKVTPAEDVHHVKSPFRGGDVNYNMLLDYHNLESVCRECHGNIHASQQGHRNPEEILKALDELFEELEKDDNWRDNN